MDEDSKKLDTSLSGDLTNSIDNAPCGFLVFTDDGKIQKVNATLRTLLGYGLEEIEGNFLSSILSPGGRVFLQTQLFPILKLQGKMEEIYLSLRTKSGEDIPVLLNGVRHPESHSCTAVVVPMHRRSRFEEELLRAKKAAEEATQAKEEAYAALTQAHEAVEAQRKELQIKQEQLLVLSEREHRIAEVLQSALRPEIPSETSGMSIHPYYQPALDEAEIGGDFYDVFHLTSDTYALVVADVSGKGLLAASQVATVRHMLRAVLYRQDILLGQRVASLNDMLAEHSLLEGFATLFVGAYNAKERTLTHVNAGQEPGLIRRFATGQIEELPPTGPVLGSFAGADFSQRVTALYVGDVLALFTDGLTEAGTHRKSLLEIDGVALIFHAAVQDTSEGQDFADPFVDIDTDTAASIASEISRRMMAGVTAKVTDAGIRDDVCLLIAQIR